MALFVCISCNKTISNRGNYCPYCGIFIGTNSVEMNNKITDTESVKKDVANDRQKFLKNDKRDKCECDTSYVIDYINENEYKRKERAIKKYSMLTYKKLLFDYYQGMRKGSFEGILVSSNKNELIDKYELPLPTDKTFMIVHGNITLHYTVYKKQRVVMLESLTPEDILTVGHQKELTTYKGVMVSKCHQELDMFKINLLNSMNKN